MPNYGTPQSGGVLTALYPGDQFVLFNAETPTAPQASIAFCRAPSPGAATPSPILFTLDCANASPTIQIDIQGSNTDVDADYISLSSIVNLQHGFYSDLGGFLFYRGKLVSGSGDALTLKVQR